MTGYNRRRHLLESDRPCRDGARTFRDGTRSYRVPDLSQLFIGILLIITIHPLLSNDLFWHLAAGREMAATGRMLYHDVFSFTRYGAEWFYHEPLFGLMVYGLFVMGKYKLLILFMSLLIAGIPALFYSLFRNKDQVLVTVAMAVWFLLSFRSFTLRPQLFSFYFLLLLLHVLERRQLTWLPLITLLWANLHGSFILGLAIIIIYGSWDCLNHTVTRNRLLLYLAALLAPVLNPHFLSLYIYPFQYLGKTLHSTFITEWFPPTFAEYPYFFVIAPLILVFYLWHWWASRFSAPSSHLSVLPIPLLLTVCLLTYLGFTSVRHLPLAGIGYAFSISLLPDKNYFKITRLIDSHAANTGIFMLLVLFAAMFLTIRVDDYHPREFPSAAVLEAVRARPERNILANYGLGGFLVWQLGPEKKVFIDGRADLYGEQIMKDYVRLYYFFEDWPQLLNQYPVELLILDHTSPLLAIFGKDRIFSDNNHHIIPVKSS